MPLALIAAPDARIDCPATAPKARACLYSRYRHKHSVSVAGALIILLLLPACEQLGLDDDDKNHKPVVEEAAPQPPVVVVTPQVNYPIINRLFFEAVKAPGEPESLTQTYSIDTSSFGVLRQSAGQAAETIAPLIPLGNGRFTRSYSIIEENDRFFLGDPTSDSLRQLTGFSEAGCGSAGAATDRRLLTDGLGFANSALIVRYGSDLECGAGIAAYARLSLTASPLTLPGAASKLEFFGQPLKALDGSILGFFMANNGVIDLRTKDDTLIRSFQASAVPDLAQEVGYAQPYGSEIVFSMAGQLYRLTPEALADPGFELEPLATLESASLSEQQQVLRGTDLFFIDNSQLKVLKLASNTAEVVADLGVSGTLLPRLEASTSFLWALTSAGQLIRIEPQTGVFSSLGSITAEGGGFLAGGAVVFASLATTPPQAVVFAENASGSPSCDSESPANGCYSDARWLLFDQYREDGIIRLPILQQGREATVERLVNGVTKTDDIPATEYHGDDAYLNASELTLFDNQSGAPILTYSTRLSGAIRIDGISVIEQDFGLIRYVSWRGDQLTLADLYLLDIGSRAGVSNAGSTNALQEELLTRSRD